MLHRVGYVVLKKWRTSLEKCAWTPSHAKTHASLDKERKRLQQTEENSGDIVPRRQVQNDIRGDKLIMLDEFKL